MPEPMMVYPDGMMGPKLNKPLKIQGPLQPMGDVYFGSGDPWRDLKVFAKCDALSVADLSTTSGSPIVGSASGLFTPADVGKSYDLFNTANLNTAALTGTVVGYLSPTQLRLDQNLPATLNNLTLVWGTDDTAAVQTWANQGGLLRGSGTTLCFVKGLVTLPATSYLIGGPLRFWVSAALGAGTFLDVSNVPGSFVMDGAGFGGIRMQCSPGFTGRALSGVGGNEAGTDMLFRDVRIQTLDQSDHDYVVFLQAIVANLERCRFIGTAPNSLSRKIFAHTAVISQCTAEDCNFFGRIYHNAQQYTFRGCGLGPIGAANNSAADGTGVALQTNTAKYDSCYMYSSGVGGTDYPTVRSVLATNAGEGANGGCFPVLTFDSCFINYGAGAGVTQRAVLGTFTAQGGTGTGATFDGCGFVQSATSPATIVHLIESSGGPGQIIGRDCSANILAAVATAIIFVAAAGVADAIWDYMPSGQATPWQHPGLSSSTGAPANLPASGTAVRNVFPCPFDMWITPGTNPITKIEMSVDNATFVTLWTGAGAIDSPIPFRWPAGTWLRFTYAAGQPTYLLIPAP